MWRHASPVPRPMAGACSDGPRLYRRFIRTALILTLSLGATWGVFNLTWIMFTVGPVPASHVQAHGQVQVFGFIYLFIMGVAYQVIPRFRGRPLRFPRLAEASFLFLVTGVLLRAIGQPIAYLSPGRVLLFMSAPLYVLGLVSFAAVILATALPAPRPPLAGPESCSAATPRLPRQSRMEPYILAGILWMVVGGCLAAGQAVYLAWNGLTSQSAAWQQPLWFVALFGGALSWVFGIATRVVPGFLGTRPARPGWVLMGFVFLQVSVLMMIGSLLAWLGHDPVVWVRLRAAATFGAGLAIFATVFALHGLMSRGGQPLLAIGPQVFRRFLFAAFFWAGVAAAMMMVVAFTEWTKLRPAHHLLQDAARHVFTVGFLVMVVFGMASRILPVFEGTMLARPALVEAGFLLLNLGVLLRLGQVGAAFWWPPFMAVAGLSGFLALGGIVLLSVVLLATMKGHRPVAA